jgi:hypothetical protein
MDKRSSEQIGDLAMKLAAEDELARIEGLSEAELERELAADGVDLSQIPSASELLAKATAAGSAAPAPFVAVASVASAPGEVVEFAPRRSPRRASWVAWLAAAAIGAGVVIAGVAEAPVVVAWWQGPQVPPPAPTPAPPAPPTELARAVELRQEAQRACEAQSWTTCAKHLDDARALDPAGEGGEAVRAMRERIVLHTSPPMGPKPQ